MHAASGTLGGWAAHLVAPWFDLLDQRWVVSYVASGLFVLLFVAIARGVRRRRLRVSALVRLMFRRSVWLHRSSLLDYKLYALNLVLTGFMLGVLLTSAHGWASLVGAALDTVVTPQQVAPGVVTTAGVALLLLLAMDLGYWLCHLLMHRVPALWEFHKLHHSALVMTPATEYRQHPVELVLFPNVQAVTIGLAYGTAAHWLGEAAVTQGAMAFGAVMLVHYVTFHHLRHSHLHIAFTGILGRLLHSPAHHLIHHSADPAHFDRNMGYLLSIWDWMAGTLVMPRRGQRLVLGIGPDGAEHDTVWRAMWHPVRNAWALLRRPSAAKP